MKPFRLLVATLALIFTAYGQSTVAGDRHFLGVTDSSNALRSLPFRTGTVLPVSCTGEEWFSLSSGNSRAIYYCSNGTFTNYTVATSATPATTTTLGMVKVGSGLAVDVNGVLSTTGSASVPSGTAGLTYTSGAGSINSVHPLSGTGSTVLSGTGTYTSTHSVVVDASGNVVDSGKAPVQSVSDLSDASTVLKTSQLSGSNLNSILTLKGTLTIGHNLVVASTGADAIDSGAFPVQAPTPCAPGYHYSSVNSGGVLNCTADVGGSGGGLSAPASNGLVKYNGTSTLANALLADVTTLTGTGATAATSLGLSTVAGSGLSTALTDSNLLVRQDTGGNVTVNGNVNSGGAGSVDGSVSTFGASSGQIQLTGKTSTNIFTQTVDDATGAWQFKWPTSAPSQNGMTMATNTNGSSSWVNPVLPATTTFQGLQNNGTALVTTLPVIEAAALGIVCDGAFDNTTAFTNAAAANHAIHLPDGSTCKGRITNGVSNTRWFCSGGCSISHKTTDTGDEDVYIGYSHDIEYDGIVFDDSGTNHQSFVGGSNAQTTLITASGGSGWQANYSVPFSASGGGCTNNAAGYFTTNSSGVPNAVYTYVSGTGCTSVPTTWSTGSYCGDGITGCVAPTLTWQSGLTPQAASVNGALIYVESSTNIRFKNCTVRSTGASLGNLASDQDVLSFFNTDALLDNLTIDNTLVGTHIYNDSNGRTDRFVTIRNIHSTGSMMNGIRMKGHPGNTEVDGGIITMQSPDPLAQGGQDGNGISIYDTDHNYVHGVTVINPDFSGVRVTGDSNHSSTHPTAYNRIEDVMVQGNQEMGAWAELGAEFNDFRNITVEPSPTQSSAGCLEDTNSSQRPHYGYNYFYDIHCIGQLGAGIVVEHALVVNPTTKDVAVPYRIGFGCTSNGVVIRGATSTVTGTGYSTPALMFALDQCGGTPSAVKGTNYLQFNTQPDYPFGSTATVPYAYTQFDNFPLIGGFTAANPAVISYIPNTATAWPFTVGNTYLLQGIYGGLNAAGQSLNGRLCGVTAVDNTAHTVTCGGVTGVPALDSTGYGITQFKLAPEGRGNGMFWWIYKSGNTTPAWSANSLMNTTNAF